MRAPRTKAVAIIALLSATAAADPAPPLGGIADPAPPPPGGLADPGPDLSRPVRLLSGSTVRTDGGSVLHLPPGRFLREDLWQTLDAETRRLQDVETRLTATNADLRATLGGWQPGWWALLGAAVAGVGAGWYVRKL